MSKYTTEVRFICEAECGYTESQGGKKVNEIITEAAPKIFDFAFPIFDEAYRLPLEVKILRHFYTREICEETVALWKLRLEDKLNVIMPYYNKLYQSELLEFNPLYDVDYQREHTRDYEGNENRRENKTDTTSGNITREKGATGESNTTENMTDTIERERANTGETNVTETTENEADGTLSKSVNTTDTESGSGSKEGEEETHATGTSSNTHWDLYSDTPQGGVEGIARATDDIVNNAYLTNARKVTDNGETSDNGTRTYSEDTTSTLSKTGTETETDTKHDENSETVTGTTTTENNEDETITDTKATTGRVTTENNEDETIEESRTLTGTATNVSDITNTEEYTEHVFGKQGGITYSKMLEEFRATFLNIDRMILRDLSDLFFGLWA